MSLYTQKHFIDLARYIAIKPDRAERVKLSSFLASIFTLDNPKFDLEKFFKACNL